MALIVIFDDAVEIGEMLTSFCHSAGYKSRFYHEFNAENASDYHDATYIILDLNMPDQDGIDAIEALSLCQIRAPIILCSGIAEDIIDSTADIIVNTGLVYGGKLLKPFNYDQFLSAISNARLKSEMLHSDFTTKPAVNLTRGDLEISIKRGWFKHVYQPQVDLNTGAVVGVECLARLYHPLFGVCYPDSFIQKLVDYNLMDSFTISQLSSALEALATLAMPADIRISLNIDPCSLRKDFLDRLENIVAESSFNPSQICFEVTEMSAVALSLEVKTLLAKLRMRGFHISLDDFGTGFSTIQELDVLPFNEIKIDRSFVANMHVRKAAHIIIKHTVALANDMNVLVIAEGIETKQQAATMQELGCNYLQGYLFSRPLELDALANYLSSFSPLEITSKLTLQQAASSSVQAIRK